MIPLFKTQHALDDCLCKSQLDGVEFLLAGSPAFESQPLTHRLAKRLVLSDFQLKQTARETLTLARQQTSGTYLFDLLCLSTQSSEPRHTNRPHQQ